MNNRVLFMIIDNQIKYLSGSDMDHREWYISLGLDPNNFENIVRGYVMDEKIVFYKGSMFNYDNEVINAARVFTPNIRATLNINYEVYCGILISSYNSKWEPVLKINEDEITGFVQQKVKKPENEKKEYVESGPIIEFKNNYEDPKFIKKAIIVTSCVMLITLIIKVILFSKQQILQVSNGLDILLAFSQIVLLGVTIFGYIKKLSYTKYLGLAASILIILTLDIFDIIVGILYFLFNIDQNYFTNFINFIKKLKRR